MAAPGLADSREELWNATFETYYVALYEEVIADGLTQRWARIDEATKVLVAITASGSAVSGWALWSQPGNRLLWVLLSGTAAFLSVIHTALGIPGRIKAHGEDKRRFASLRTDLETFRYKMRVEQENFDVHEFTREFEGYRKRFSESVQLVGHDFARTSGFEIARQKEVNQSLANEILTDEE
jgi:hypothetical protein